ncbi:MAG: YqcC family protein [Porticoccaceae bacterium]
MNLLNELQTELKLAGLWSDTEPSKAPLSSIQPFGLDTLTFYEWLQFVLVKKLRLICDRRESLPDSSDVTTMAEEVFKSDEITAPAVIRILITVDRFISHA